MFGAGFDEVRGIRLYKGLGGFSQIQKIDIGMKVGDTAELNRVFTTSDVESFAELSGDLNPIHLQDDFARMSRFGQKIVHGFLVSSLLSAVIAEKIPGPGSIYLEQSLRFNHPVYHGDEVRAVIEVKHIRSDKPIISLATNCFVGVKNVISGEAKILLT